MCAPTICSTWNVCPSHPQIVVAVSTPSDLKLEVTLSKALDTPTIQEVFQYTPHTAFCIALQEVFDDLRKWTLITCLIPFSTVSSLKEGAASHSPLHPFHTTQNWEVGWQFLDKCFLIGCLNYNIFSFNACQFSVCYYPNIAYYLCEADLWKQNVNIVWQVIFILIASA